MLHLHHFLQVFDPFGGCGTTLFLKVCVNCVFAFPHIFRKSARITFSMVFVTFLLFLLHFCSFKGDIRNNYPTIINVGKGEAERTPVHANPGVGSAMTLNLAAEN